MLCDFQIVYFSYVLMCDRGWRGDGRAGGGVVKAHEINGYSTK